MTLAENRRVRNIALYYRAERTHFCLCNRNCIHMKKSRHNADSHISRTLSKLSVIILHFR